MLKIGIFDKTDVSDILLKIYKADSINLYSDNFSKAFSNERIFISTDYNICFLVANIYNDGAFINMLGKDDMILVNADTMRDLKAIKNTKAKVITYGFNPKACITASSINEADYKTIQFCIQRAIPTFSGRHLEQQEFPIRIITNNDVGTVLAAITVALVNDFAVDKIKSYVI